MHGVIHTLAPTTAHAPRLPVDYLFRSLAQDLGRSTVGIVLSGTGTDGTLGLKAIKEAGGFTFAQDPTTAKFDGMPRSALASGATDYSLPLKEIAAELTRIAQRLRVRPDARKTAVAKDQDLYGKLFVLIRA
jgi:two-component system CheB/CheR fusion protein